MPPKPKFTKEDFAKAALDIIKEEGVDALTARNLGKRLGTSSRPVFTAFNSMDEVKLAAREIALREFEEYASDFTEYTPAFKRIGMLIVSYGIHQPELFKLLFMQEHIEGRNFQTSIQDLGDMVSVCIELIQRDYEMTAKEAGVLFEDMWIYTFGIGSLCAMRVCDFTEDEIAKKLGQAFAGMVMIIKSGNLENIVQHPVKGTAEYSYEKLMEHLNFFRK